MSTSTTLGADGFEGFLLLSIGKFGDCMNDVEFRWANDPADAVGRVALTFYRAVGGLVVGDREFFARQ